MFNSHDLLDRQLIAAVREYDSLIRRRYTIIKLDRPIQRGWRRFHVLSERAATRPDRLILEAILTVVGTIFFHHNPKFSWRRGRRKRLVEIEQPLRPIPTYEWKQKNYPDEWLYYFRCEFLPEWHRRWRPYWIFTQPSLFEFKIERNWWWYFREVDPAIETRLSELDRWLQARKGWQRYGRLRGHRQRWKYRHIAKQQNLKCEHERDIAYACKIFPEVEPGAPQQRSRFSFQGIISIFSPRSPMQRYSA